MKPIYFEIPFNGVKVSKSKFIIPEYTLPAKDWLVHNQIDLSNKTIGIHAFIRNPLERVVLQYLSQLKQRPALKQYPMTFKDWCLASFTNSNTDKFMQNNPKDFLSQSKWIEGLSNEKLKINSLNIYTVREKINFEKVNVEKYYDNFTKNLISSWYTEDFQLLNGLS